MKKYISLGVGVALLISPILVSAQTTQTNNSVEASLIAALTQLVQELEQELQQLLALDNQTPVTQPTPVTSPYFSATPTSGTAPLQVTFTMKGGADAFDTFDFGDGDAFSVGAANNFDNVSCDAAAQNTVCQGTHTYTAAGTYIAMIKDSSGNLLGTATIIVSSAATIPTNPTPTPPLPMPSPTSSAMKLSATFGGGGQNLTQMPRTMSFSASYPVPSFANPNDTATYTISYGDGTSAAMTYQNVGCPVDGGGSCMATWSAPDHTYTIPGEYTATLYKNGTQIDSASFLAFAADIKSSTSAGLAGPSGPSGAVPLTVTFSFTGGTSIDFGDGSAPQNLCSNCSSQWSTTQHTIQHTYTTGGYHQMVITYNGLDMEGAGISALSGTITSISPSSGPIGTSVTIYGSGFTSAGDVDFLSLCSSSNSNCGAFTFKTFTIAPDDSSITFTIPATYTVNTATCTSDGGGCTSNPPQTQPVLPATYSVGFDGTGFAAELPLKFTVTP